MGRGDGLGPRPVSNLDPTYQTPPKTKHTCELVALVQVQAGEFHALEHLDIAWGNGVGRERVRKNGERFPGKFFARWPGATPCQPLYLPVNFEGFE